MPIKTFVNGPVETNNYIVWGDDGQCVIIDCEGTGENIIAFLEANALRPNYILLTHGHFDHIGAVERVASRFGCRVAIGKKDRELLPGQKEGKKNPKKVMEPECLLQENDVIHTGSLTFTVMETPGHTKGGVCYLTEDSIFTGDTLFQGDCGRTDLYGGDWETMQKSLGRLYAIEKNLHVFPGHGPASTLDEERRTNPYLKPYKGE